MIMKANYRLFRERLLISVGTIITLFLSIDGKIIEIIGQLKKVGKRSFVINGKKYKIENVYSYA